MSVSFSIRSRCRQPMIHLYSEGPSSSGTSFCSPILRSSSGHWTVQISGRNRSKGAKGETARGFTSFGTHTVTSLFIRVEMIWSRIRSASAPLTIRGQDVRASARRGERGPNGAKVVEGEGKPCLNSCHGIVVDVVYGMVFGSGAWALQALGGPRTSDNLYPASSVIGLRSPARHST